VPLPKIITFLQRKPRFKKTSAFFFFTEFIIKKVNIYSNQHFQKMVIIKEKTAKIA